MRALIAGGGIGGLVAALCLHRRGLDVAVLEQAPQLGEVGAGIQLGPNAMHVLRHLGCEEELQALAFEPEAAAMREHRSGRPLLTTPLRGAHSRRYGAPYLHVHRADLLGVLQKALEAAGVPLHLGAGVRGFRQDEQAIHLDCGGGGDFSGQLLVGADGIHSAVREAMLGPDEPTFTGHVAWRGLVPTKQIPKALRPAPMANIWLGPGRHFVAYYLRRGQLVNFVAVEERGQWIQESWSQQADIAEVRRAYDGWDPVVGAILDGCRQAFLWGLFDRTPLPRWSKGRAVLLGDACHPMLPFQAQGAAMAIEDGHVLARHCEAARDGGLPRLEAALQAYQRQRQPRTTAMQRASRSNAGLFHAATVAARGKRRLMLGIARLFPRAAQARLDAIYGLDVTAGG